MLVSEAVAHRAREFERRTYASANGGSMPYRLFVPTGYGETNRRYPLVLWLHGGEGRGNDNEKQIAGGNDAGATVWIQPRNQARFPAFVLAPQCPEGEMWTTAGLTVRPTPRLMDVIDLLRKLEREYRIDPARIYVAGQSMGGFAVWSLVTAYPRMFAAAVPICGGGDEALAERLVGTPIWAFHGELDRAVSVERSRSMVAAVVKAGGRARLTEYKGAGHTVWQQAFADPELLPWVFEQNRRKP